jgi:hypothetical protein
VSTEEVTAEMTIVLTEYWNFFPGILLKALQTLLKVCHCPR